MAYILAGDIEPALTTASLYFKTSRRLERFYAHPLGAPNAASTIFDLREHGAATWRAIHDHAA